MRRFQLYRVHQKGRSKDIQSLSFLNRAAHQHKFSIEIWEVELCCTIEFDCCSVPAHFEFHLKDLETDIFLMSHQKPAKGAEVEIEQIDLIILFTSRSSHESAQIIIA